MGLFSGSMLVKLCFFASPHGAASMVAEISRKENTMRTIPEGIEIPTFPKIVVAGVEHVLTPGVRRKGIEYFLEAALKAQGLTAWHDAGAVNAIKPSIEGWWPELPCPVETVVRDDAGESYARWPMQGYPDDEAAFLAAYPEDAPDIRAFFAWQRRVRERYEALHAVCMAVEAAGALRRRHVLNQVVDDLENQVPGFVGERVSAHCADGHVCSAAEHDVQDMV